MELSDIRALILSADPKALHYECPGTGSYTTWQERKRLDIAADDKKAGGWRFTIDRYFDCAEPVESDPVADAIERVLDARPDVSYTREVIVEPGSGYIHNAFTCEVI